MLRLNVDTGLRFNIISGKRKYIERVWTPELIPSCILFVLSTRADTISQISDRISLWEDLSGHGNDISQATASLKPYFVANTLNGRDGVQYGQSADYNTLATSSNPFGSSISNAWVAQVFREDTRTGATHWTLTGSSVSANRWQAHIPYGTTAHFDCGAGNRVSGAVGYSAGTINLHVCYCSTTDSVQVIYQNGTSLASDATGHTVNTVGNVHCGGNGSNGAPQGTYGAFVVGNGTITTDDRQKLEGYLAHHFGIQGNLPGGHPYKSFPPLITD